MKLFADYKINDGFKNINIWYIYNGYKSYITEEKKIDFKQYYKRYFKNKIFSTHKSNKRAMCLVKKSPYGKSFFRYLSHINDNGDFESVSHSTYKEIIKEMNVLNLIVNECKIKLYVSFSDMEYYYKANGNDYFVDVFIHFDRSEPEEYFYKWNGQLCIEIKHTHAVDKKKIIDFSKEGIPIFEHTISKKLMMSENTSSEEELLNQKKFIAEKLSEKIYGKLISDPSSEEFKLILKLKKQNNDLRSKTTELENENIILKQKNTNLESEIKRLEQDNTTLLRYKNLLESKKVIKFMIKLYKIK